MERGNLFVARDIETDTGKIVAEDGFLFDGEKTLKFRKIEIFVDKGDSRFGKDFVDLITEEGKKGKNEAIYNLSLAFSSLSCVPFFFAGFLKVGLMCPAFSLGLMKLMRDTLKPDEFLSLAVISPIAFFTSVFLLMRRKSDPLAV
ncbi:hypothetical protein HRbin19_00011 [bacterium HR19]|nr:hypothetical protein HRbin19_00011 [bacterium HR19]